MSAFKKGKFSDAPFVVNHLQPPRLLCVLKSFCLFDCEVFTVVGNTSISGAGATDGTHS